MCLKSRVGWDFSDGFYKNNISILRHFCIFKEKQCCEKNIDE